MRKAVLFVIMFVVASIPAALQAQNRDGVIALNGGRNAVRVKPLGEKVSPANVAPSKLVKIYSNLGTGNNLYNADSGNGILGNNVSGQLYPEWVGCGFKPKANHLVIEIQVGATWVSGPNFLIMSLNVNATDRPGKALHTWHFKDLPDFGTCCTLQTGNFARGIPVRKGKVYWVTLRNRPQNQDTWEVWNLDSNGESGLWSNDIGSGWEQESYQQLNAFGVFGK